MYIKKYYIVFISIFLFISTDIFPQTQKDSTNKKPKWSSEQSGGFFQSLFSGNKNTTKSGPIGEKSKGEKVQKRIKKKVEELNEKYKLDKDEQQAYSAYKGGLPMQRRDKRHLRRALRKRNNYKEELREYTKELNKELQPKDARKRMEKLKKRSERYRRTGYYLPWYKRLWYKITGKIK